MSYVLSLDLGTSSLRSALFDEALRPVRGSEYSLAHQPVALPDGGVELDAEELLERVTRCLEGTLAGARRAARAVRGVGVSTFWHSTVGVDRTGHAVTPILMWADTRSVAEVEELKRWFPAEEVHQRTGCVFHTSYLPARLLWVRRNRPDWFRAADRWLSPGEFVQLRLCGESTCSISMASGTGLYRHDRGCWDPELLEALGLEPERLGRIDDAPAEGLHPACRERLSALQGVPWYPAAGDGACSNVGSGCAQPDRLAVMVGTSGAMRSMRRGDVGAIPAGLWRYRWDRDHSLTGGALSNGGNLFQWMRDTLRAPEGEALERALRSVPPDSHGLTVLPFLAGERCPGWRGDARAAIVGLRWSTRPEEILRAGLESVAYRFALIHERLRPQLPEGHRVIASGGALLSSPTWTQILADALGVELAWCREKEASSRGAAILAFCRLGVLPGPDAPAPRLGRSFQPDPARTALYREARERQARLYSTLLG